MASFNGPINESYPTPSDPAAATVSFTQAQWRISSRKLPISKSDAIDAMSASLKIPVPEMIFGDNMVALEHVSKGWCLEFNPYDALDRVDKTGATILKVKYASEWSKSREQTHENIKEVVKPFDWTYTTDYKGTVHSKAQPPLDFTAETEPIPLELLKRPDPILHFENVILYESEMDDNGISLYSVKVRVMPERMLLLARNFMRLDDMRIRIRDTRVYIDFKTNKVTREYTALEDTYDTVKQKLVDVFGNSSDKVVEAMRNDKNELAPYLPTVDYCLESVQL